MNFNLDSIFVEWRAKVPNGVPNPSNDYHLVLLKEVCFKHSVDQDIIDSVILFLEAKDKSKYAKASGGKYYVKNKKTGNVYTVVKPNPEKHDPISREKAEKEVDKDSEEKEEPKGEEKESVEDKLTKQKEKYGKLNLDEDGVPKKEPENPELDDLERKKVNENIDKLIEGIDDIDAIPDEDKELIKSGFQKVKDGKADELNDEEVRAMRDWIATKHSDSSGLFYVANIRPRNWKKGRDDRKAIPKDSASKPLASGMKKMAEAIGLKRQPPTNSRTNSKAVAPTTTNPRRKVEKISVEKSEDGTVTSVTIAGVKHSRKSVPDEQKLVRALMRKGMPEKEAKRKAKTAVLGVRRYNEELDALAEVEEFEVVDYGDTSTHEGRRDAINESLNTLANGLEKAIESTTPPNPPLTKEHYELIEKIKKIKNPLDDPEWKNLSFEEQQKRIAQFEEEMGEILIGMENLGDMQTARAEVAEAITYMHRLSQGFTTILPSSETFKVTDVFAMKEPDIPDDATPEEVAEAVADSIQRILVDVEVAGGESVKFMAGAKSASESKVSMTVYKNKATRQTLNSLLSIYDKLYGDKIGDGDFPATDDELSEIDSIIDDAIEQTVKDGIMTEEEAREITEKGRKIGEQVFESFYKRNKSKLKDWSEEELIRLKETMAKHCAAGNLMQEINNRDTEYNKFNNVKHKVGKSGYHTDEADGINVISGMNFSCDPGYNVSTRTKKVSPENRNPSAIIHIDRSK